MARVNGQVLAHAVRGLAAVALESAPLQIAASSAIEDDPAQLAACRIAFCAFCRVAYARL